MDVEDRIATEVKFGKNLFVGFEILVVFIADYPEDIPRFLSSLHGEERFLTNIDKLLKFADLTLHLNIIRNFLLCFKRHTSLV